MGEASNFIASAGTFLGINGLGQLVYRLGLQCTTAIDPYLGCKNAIGGMVPPSLAGKASESEVTTGLFILSVLCAFVAWVLADN